MSEIPVSEISGLLDEVTSKLPKLVNALMSTLYSSEAGKNMGLAVGNLYKELTASGIPADVAIDMAKEYMQTLKNITTSFNNK